MRSIWSRVIPTSFGSCSGASVVTSARSLGTGTRRSGSGPIGGRGRRGRATTRGSLGRLRLDVREAALPLALEVDGRGDEAARVPAQALLVLRLAAGRLAVPVGDDPVLLQEAAEHAGRDVGVAARVGAAAGLRAEALRAGDRDDAQVVAGTAAGAGVGPGHHRR